MRIFRLAVILPALAGALLAACHRDTPPPREFDGPGSFRYIETQVGFGPRIPGTEAHRRMATWLDSLLRARADTLVTQQWTHVTTKGDSLHLTNFLARFNPAADRRLLFLAHWDSRPHADAPASRDSTAPVPGANDGGSDVAVLLGVADVLHRAPPTIGRTAMRVPTRATARRCGRGRASSVACSTPASWHEHPCQ